MQVKWITVIIAACLCTVSCTRSKDVKLPRHQPRLVLHGYVAVGDTFEIALGKTFSSVGNLVQEDATYVTNGWVALYEGGILIDSLRYNAATQTYIARSRVAEAGKSYSIKAGAPDYPAIESNTYAPAPVSLVSIQQTKNARKTSGGTWLDDLTITFNDPPSQANFYIAALHSVGRVRVGCVYTYDPAVDRHYTELVPFEQDFCIDSDEILYNDKTFNGTLKALTISVFGPALDTSMDQSGRIFRPYLKRYSITEDHYNYFRSAAGPAFIEQGPTFSEFYTKGGNVRNGYGLFTVYAMVTDTIR